MTRQRPADDDVDGLGGFAEAERAERRLLFDLAELGLPILSWRDRAGGLAFDLLSSARETVATGHADGVTTLELHETDAVQRETRRQHLDEPYPTVLGYLRHEVAHCYQPILAAEGAPEDWESSFVSLPTRRCIRGRTGRRRSRTICRSAARCGPRRRTDCAPATGI